MSEEIWFKDPSVLFTASTWSRFVPTKDMTTSEALNSVVRFSTYFAVVLFVATGVGQYILAIPVVMVATILLIKLFPNGKIIESFVSKVVGDKYVYPTPANPFMNVLLTDISDNPERGETAPVDRKDVRDAIAKSFAQPSDMYMDTSDIFEQATAMRQFYTISMKDTENNLEGFLKWLAKGTDVLDYSSNPLARSGKILTEGHIKAKGSMKLPPTSMERPRGTMPSGNLGAPRT
jgi:hypothetical protein